MKISEVGDFKLGDSQVQKVYLGGTLVWEKFYTEQLSPPSQPWISLHGYGLGWEIIELTWGGVYHADGYRLELYFDGIKHNLDPIVSGGTTTKYEIEIKYFPLPYDFYFSVFARAADPKYLESDASTSTTMSLAQEQLGQPVDCWVSVLKNNNDYKCRFSWSNVIHAAEYEVKILLGGVALGTYTVQDAFKIITITASGVPMDLGVTVTALPGHTYYVAGDPWTCTTSRSIPY